VNPGRVVAVGLGPAGADLMLPSARSTISYLVHRYARTTRHPAITELSQHGLEFHAFDDRYDAADNFDDLYRGIVDTLIAAAAEHRQICYAVPGNPGVAERTVTLLREADRRGEIELEIIPGLSFADLAWSRLEVDPMDGARLVDGQQFAIDAAGMDGPLLIGHCTSRMVLSDIKLVLLGSLPPDAPVQVLQRLGLPDESITTVALEALDRDVEADHLTSIFVDAGTGGVA
jgi:tetrapyrrole methylase family protein/MazG family protein